jgi:folate-binding protein YgfZ
MTTTFATRTTRDVIRVSGPDAMSYLQGQVSQDLDALAVGTSTWTFVLQPQGKVDGWARITKTSADCFCLDTDAGAGAALEERLRRFLLRTKADLESFSEPCVLVRGPNAPRDVEMHEGILRLPVSGPGVEGYDLLGSGAEVPAGVEEADLDTYEAYRVAHGVPVVGRELREDTIPAEVGQWIVDQSVSFTKGCFVGQELVARIDSRGGNVPRHLRVIVLDGPVDVGAEVEADGPAGPVTTVAHGAAGPVALAYCGRRVEPGSSVVVGGVRGVVHDVPLGASGAA